jgi:hypothetical protein
MSDAWTLSSLDPRAADYAAGVLLGAEILFAASGTDEGKHRAASCALVRSAIARGVSRAEMLGSINLLGRDFATATLVIEAAIQRAPDPRLVEVRDVILQARVVWEHEHY